MANLKCAKTLEQLDNKQYDLETKRKFHNKVLNNNHFY